MLVKNHGTVVLCLGWLFALTAPHILVAADTSVEFRRIPTSGMNSMYLARLTEESSGIEFWELQLYLFTAPQASNPEPCWRYHRSPAIVLGVLANESLIKDDEMARSLVAAGVNAYVKACGVELNDGIKVLIVPRNARIVDGRADPVLVEAYSNRGPSLTQYKNYVAIAEQEKREQERQERRRQASRELYTAFVKKNHVDKWPTDDELHANPFVFQNKVIGMIAQFVTMTSPTEAVLAGGSGRILVTKVPPRLFTRRSSVVLAGRVLGRRDVPGAAKDELALPVLEFVDAHICGDASCPEMFLWKR